MPHLAVNWPAVGIMTMMSTWYLIPLVIFILSRRNSKTSIKNGSMNPNHSDEV